MTQIASAPHSPSEPLNLAGPAPERIVELSTLARLAAAGQWRIALPHARAHHLLLWVTRGQGRAAINGVRRGLGAGNVVWLPAGTQFSLDLGPQVFGQALIFHGSDPSLLPLRPQHLRVRDVTLQGELTGLIELIQRESATRQPLQDEALLAKFILVEVWLRRMMLLVGEPGDTVQLALPPRANAARKLAERFAVLAEAQFRSGLSMADFADQLSVTPTHLTRVCKQVAGMTAADLLTGRVLHEARCLLAETKLPAKRIAEHLGFGSAPYFSRFILKHTGKPPSELRSTS
ncbi:AraC family transcriptional regulator [Roseobacteraceae bacterium S113]